MPKPAHSSPVVPHAACSARQVRSRDTLKRILEAAEKQLETQEFDELTMVDLAREAGCAVGTLYGRVPNKEALLLCLHERYLESGMSKAATVFEAGRDDELEERVEKLCGLMVDFFSAHRGVTRAVTNFLFARPSGDAGATVASIQKSATAGFKQAAAFLAEKVDRATHPDPQAACEFGLLAANDVAQSRVVFGRRSGLRMSYSGKVLKARLSALLLAYLRHGGRPA